MEKKLDISLAANGFIVVTSLHFEHIEFFLSTISDLNISLGGKGLKREKITREDGITIIEFSWSLPNHPANDSTVVLLAKTIERIFGKTR